MIADQRDETRLLHRSSPCAHRNGCIFAVISASSLLRPAQKRAFLTAQQVSQGYLTWTGKHVLSLNRGFESPAGIYLCCWIL